MTYPAGWLRMPVWGPTFPFIHPFPTPVFGYYLQPFLWNNSWLRLEAKRALWPSRWSIGQRQMKQNMNKWREVKREREKGRTVVAQRKLSLNCCENRLSRVERQAVFWLDRSNVRLCAEHPASINSSESFHSIGGQLGLTELTPCFPSSYNPSYPLFRSCQSVSPQIIPLTELSDYTDFSWPSTRPSVLRHFDTVSPSTSVTDWTMRHMTLVQTGEKNEIRHVIQCEGVRGNDCSSLHRHAHTHIFALSTSRPMLIVNIWSTLFHAVERHLPCLLCAPSSSLVTIKPQSKQKYEEKPGPAAAVRWLKLKVTAWHIIWHP